jgi:eukaryotic-like serine/threonine-protein kinase
MRAATGGDANDQTRVERHDPLVGTTLDQRFRIDFQIAAGGFGAIYRATDLRSDAEVALKVLHPRLASDPMVVARFRREGKTLSNLRDPHTITAYEIGEAPDGTLYIVMELLHGESLYQRFRSIGPMPWRRVLHIARGVCSSLAEAHALGIVHRDLKPANIHLETRDNDLDFVKVLDFGIAKIVHGGGGEPDRNELTQAGQMIGTVDYMSPEQLVGGEMTPASDIYTLGVVIYEMIGGRTPFADAQNPTAILAAVLTQTPEPLSRYAVVPPALEQIIARCLERDPQNRFAEISELVDALEVVTGGLAQPGSAGPVITRVPSIGFEQAALTTEATRIDVRFTESSQPVLDVRGPRYRPADAVASPAVIPQPHLAPVVGGLARPIAYPAASPPHAVGSQPAIDARGVRPVMDRRGSQPLIDVAAWQQQQLAQQHQLAHQQHAQQQQQHQLAQYQLMQRQQHAPHQPHGHAGGPSPVLHAPVPYVPRARASTYNVRSYDMTAAATQDAMVRRIIWIALFVCAVIALVIATR